MIVKVKMLTREKETITMMFGNSYKNWYEQFKEYLNLQNCWWNTNIPMKINIIKILSVENSKSNWISWGGLKWCSEDNFQYNLNREGRQSNESDNPKPRQYTNMKFYTNDNCLVKCRAYLKIRLRGYKDISRYKVNSDNFNRLVDKIDTDIIRASMGMKALQERRKGKNHE